MPTAPRRLRAFVAAMTSLLGLFAGLTGCVMGPEFPEPATGFVPVPQMMSGVNWVYGSEPSESDRPLMVLVHGTPGDWSGFSWYLADPVLRTHFQLVAPDRPGFGQTKMPVMPRLSAQAEVLLAGLPKDQPLWVVGHSLGGPLALWMAVLAPERVRGVVLLAASIDPRKEAPRWFNRLADTTLAQALLPDTLVRSNDEIMVLQSELERLLPRIAALRIPVLSIQGERDGLVHPDSPDALSDVLTASGRFVDLRWPDAGHFLLWDQPERVRDTIVGFHLTESKTDFATRDETPECCPPTKASDISVDAE